MKILLLDAYFLFHRANIKFGKSEEFKDKPDYQLIFNFFRSLKVLVNDFKPDKVFLCLEGSNIFRYSLYSGYKSNRIIKTAHKSEKDKEEFNRQVKIILQLIKYLPIISVYAEKYEADDVIGTLAQNLLDDEVIIISADTDYLQLLQGKSANLKIFNPIKKQYYEAPDYHYLAFKSLKGDSSDNIPGLVSEKEAEQLVKDPVKLDRFLSIQENNDNFTLNKNLIEIKIIPDQELLIEDQYSVNFDNLKQAFQEMEFTSMLTDKYWNSFQEAFKNLT